MNRAGDLSYPIYLIHTFTLILFGGRLLNMLPVSVVSEGYVSIAAFLGITIVSAAAVHWLLEVPVAQLMRFSSPLPKFGA